MTSRLCAYTLFLGLSATVTWSGEAQSKLRFGLDSWHDTGQIEQTSLVLSLSGVFARTSRADLKDSLGGHVQYEQRIGPRIGIAFGIGWAATDVENATEFLSCDRFGRTCTGEVEVIPASVGLHIYLTPHKRVDLYGGPVLGHAWVDDLETTLDAPIAGVSRGAIQLEDTMFFGGVIGFDYPIGSGSWAFASSLRAVKTYGQDRHRPPTFSHDLEPIRLFVGAVYRFRGRGATP